MRDFFASMYELLSSLYGNDLGLHLYGWDGVAFDNNSLYVSVGIAMVLISFLTMALFYYIINSPSFSRWYHWLMVLVGNVVINYFVAFYLAYLDYNNGDIADDIAPLIDSSHLHFWGLANAIYAILFFVIFSFTFRWWSTNCSTTPIPS